MAGYDRKTAAISGPEVAAVDFCTFFAKSLLNRKKIVTLSHLIDQVVKGGLGIVERRSLFFIGPVPPPRVPASGK